MMRSEGGGFLVLFKVQGCRVTPRFYHMVSDVNQAKGKAGCIQDFLVWPQEWKDSPSRDVKSMVRGGNRGNWGKEF